MQFGKPARFLGALSRALTRGVDVRVGVRVIIDDVGSRYSWPSTVAALCQRGIIPEIAAGLQSASQLNRTPTL